MEARAGGTSLALHPRVLPHEVEAVCLGYSPTKSGATNRALITFTFNTVSQDFTFGTAYFRAFPSIISVFRVSS